MAPNNHLSWHRLDQFGGIWDEKPASTMPANAAQVMSGCHPQAAGGLRAFFRPRPFLTTAGLSRGAGVKWRPTALYPTENKAFIITALVDTTIATDAVRPPNATPHVRVTKTDGTGWAVPAGTVSIPGTAAVTGVEFAHSVGEAGVLNPEASDGSQWCAIDNITGEVGSYKFWEFGENFQKQGTGGDYNSVVADHQDRIVMAYGPSIIFTSPGLGDFPTGTTKPGQFINFGNRPVAWMLSMPPDDLLVGLANGAIYNVQGPLDDPYVRVVKPPETSASLLYVSGAVLTDKGPAALSPALGPILVSTGGGVQPLAPGLKDDHWRTREGGMGLAYSDGFLFARSDGLYQQELQRRIAFATTGDPHASTTGRALVWPAAIQSWVTENKLDLNGLLTWDAATGAWFRSAHPDVVTWPMPWHVAANRGQAGYPSQGAVVGLSNKEFTDTTEPLGYGHYSFGPRQHTWEWKSAPFHSEAGRQVRLREVQLGASGHTETSITAGPSTILVTAENEHGEVDTDTVTVQPGTDGVYRARVRMDGTYVSVSLKSVSNHTAVEAPTLEFVAFGFDEGKTVYQKA